MLASSPFPSEPHESPTPARPVRRLGSTHIPWIGLSLLSLLLALGAGLAIDQRRNTVAAEMQNAAFLARILEEQTVRQLQAVDSTLAGLAARARLDATPRTAHLDESLLDASRANPLLRSLSVLDAQGTVIASSHPENRRQRIDIALLSPPANADQPGLSAWLDGGDLVTATPPADRPARGGSASAPQAAASTGVVGMTRLVPGAAGPARYVVAALNVGHLSDELATTVKDSGYRAMLLDGNARMLATSSPAPDRGPGDVIALPPRMQERLASERHGGLEDTGLDGRDAVSAFRATRDFPWVLVVERPASSVVASWREDIAWPLVLTACLGVAIGAATLLAWRARRDHERLEQTLDATRLRLQEIDQSMRGLIEAAPAPMFVLDSLGHFAMVNRALEDFLGIGRDALLGAGTPLAKRLQRLAWHPVHDVALWQDAGQSRYLDDLPGADGRMREALVSKVAIAGADGRTRVVIGSISDVTELREAERHTREAIQAARQAGDAKDEFIANMSHGLRTPLQSVLGFAELGRWRSAEHKPLQDMFEEIHAAGKRMLMLVNDLLDLSKLESSVGTLHRDTTDAIGLTREVVRGYEAACASRGVAVRQLGLLDRSGAAAECTAWGDRLRLQQALRNVFENALRFSPPRSTIDVELGRMDDGHLCWSIRDHGPGIPDIERPRMFEAFFHGHRNRDDGGGFGLGLAITSKIIQAHAGTVWAENNPDGGAVFHLRIPCGRPRPDDPTRRMARPDEAQTATQT